METFHVRVDTTGGVISTRPFWIAPGYMAPQITPSPLGGNLGGFFYDALPEAMALLGIYNKRGSNKIIRIREIEINSQPPANIAMTSGTSLRLRNIINSSGGDDTASTIKLDSSNATLSDLQMLVNVPYGNASIANNDMRRVYAMTYNQGTFSSGSSVTYLPWFAETNFGLRSQSRYGGSQFYTWSADSNIQKIVLREDEGIGVYYDTFGCNINLEYQISVWVRVVSTGACYVLKATAISGDGWLFTLMNSSATNVIEILKIEINEQGNSNGPFYMVEQIENLVPDRGGELITPTKMDSADTLNSNILCYKNCYVQMEGFSQGALITSNMNQWTKGFGPTVGPNLAMGPIPIKTTVFNFRCGIDWVLREGYGMAVINRGWGNQSEYDIIVKFTQEDVTTGGGGHIVGQSLVR